MATNKAQAAEKVSKRASATPAASEYTIEELADNYRTFNTYREIVTIALRKAGRDKYTLAEAKAIVEKFKNKEVK